MDNYNPNWVWYLCGILAIVAMGGYLMLHRASKSRFEQIKQNNQKLG